MIVSVRLTPAGYRTRDDRPADPPRSNFQGLRATRGRIAAPRFAPAQRLPNRAAVSDIRLEKPHSLSYQPMTRAIAPSTTAVCVASNVHEAGQWLKSIDTSGCVL